MDPAIAITRALRRRLGTGPQIRVAPDANHPSSYYVCIGDGGPSSFVIAWREGEPFTDEVADSWVEEYGRMQANPPIITAATPAGIRPRDTTELADILAYRMRERLGAAVDYEANLLPNEMAISVVVRQPEHLRGFHFTFRGGELPLELHPPQTATVRYTTIADPTQYVEVAGTYPAVNWAPTIPIPRDVNLEVNAIHDEINRVTAGLPVREPTETVFNVPVTANAPFTFNNIQRDNYPTWASIVDARAYGITGGIMATATNAPAATPARGVRTLEQEARLAELERMWVNIVLTDTQTTERTILRSMAPCPIPLPPVPPPRPRIRVKVWRDDYQQWQVAVSVGNAGKDLPSISVIKSLLPPADKHFLPSRQGRHSRTLNLLRVALEGGLSAQSLHDALRAWVVATEGMPTSWESNEPLLDESTAMLLNAQPATLEVGGKVYKLVPTKELDARPLIKRVRERALSLARVEGEGIRTRARTDARVVVSEAERRAATLREQVEAERRALGARAPEWVVMSGRPHSWDGSYWYVEMKVICHVKEIRYTVSTWNRVLYWTPVPVHDYTYYTQQSNKLPVWVRLREDGHYTKDDISCKGFCCTHIDSYMCMELQGLPPALKDRESLNSLEAIIGRGMQVVNLNSPLNTNPRKYWPAFLEQLPPIPLKLMTSGERADRYIIPNGRTMERWQAENPGITWDRSELIEQEAATIFHVPEGTNATQR